jgi:hypothetical protein
MAFKPCTVCSHPQALDVTKAITAGGSKREVAVRFGLSPSAVHRHRQNCLRLVGPLGKPRPSQAATPASSADRTDSEAQSEKADPKSLLEQAEHLLRDAQSVLARATRTGNDRIALAAVREIRGVVELVMRAQAEFGDRSGVGVLLGALNDRRRVEFVIADEPEGWKPTVSGSATVSDSVDDNQTAIASDPQQPALPRATPIPRDEPDVTQSERLSVTQDIPQPKRAAPEPEDYHGFIDLTAPVGSSIPIDYSGNSASDAIRSIFGRR